jgi:hypothetical protein
VKSYGDVRQAAARQRLRAHESMLAGRGPLDERPPPTPHLRIERQDVGNYDTWFVLRGAASDQLPVMPPELPRLLGGSGRCFRARRRRSC